MNKKCPVPERIVDTLKGIIETRYDVYIDVRLTTSEGKCFFCASKVVKSQLLERKEA